MSAEELAAVRAIVEQQQAQIQQLVAAAQEQHARAASPPPRPVGVDAEELKSIIDTRILERVNTFDGLDNFAEWRFGFEATCGQCPFVSKLLISKGRRRSRYYSNCS